MVFKLVSPGTPELSDHQPVVPLPRQGKWNGTATKTKTKIKCTTESN